MSAALLWLGVGVLGGVGALARALLDAAISARRGTRFPLGTLAVNLSGSALLGVLAGAAVSGEESLLAGGALIGSYTTFSTWMLESERLRREGRTAALALNVVGSLALGLAAVAAGRALGGL